MQKPDPTLLEDVISKKVLDAMRVASDALTALGIRHVVVGGLAVGANGYPRATKDVDFLVGDEAFEQHPGGLVTLKPGVPIQVNTVAIDLLSATAGEAHLSAALARPAGSFMESPPLVYMKLKSPRQKDRVDVIELVKAGIDVDACRAYLTANAPDFLAAFEASVAVARSEES